MSRVSIICFAASYAVALLLELSRLVFRSGIRGAVMIAFAAAGLFAHTTYLFYRILEFYHRPGTGGSPLSIKQEWYFIAAWLLVVVYLYLTYYHPKVPFGLFLLPLVLVLIAVGTYLADPRPFPREPASQLWGLVHGVSILLATVSVLVAFVAGLMYLGQDRRLRSKAAPSSGLRLPSLEQLQQIASRALVIALLMTGLAILAGIVLNLINWDRRVSFLPSKDPVVVRTLLMFGWLVVANGVGVVYRPAREGRNVAYLSLVSFAFLVIALYSVLFPGTQHGGVRSQGAAPSAALPDRLMRRRTGTGTVMAWALYELGATSFAMNVLSLHLPLDVATRAVRASTVRIANANEVRSRTGFAIGGVPPLGHAQTMETYIDEDLLQYPTIWAAAGTPNAIFELTPAALQDMTAGRVARVK